LSRAFFPLPVIARGSLLGDPNPGPFGRREAFATEIKTRIDIHGLAIPPGVIKPIAGQKSSMRWNKNRFGRFLS
jgi:hypothetical protein